MNLLFLSFGFPFPLANGFKLRINALVSGLAAVYDVTLLSFRRREVDETGLDEVRRKAHAW
jgi:hypothetical protein